jgi:dCMP deaminase
MSKWIGGLKERPEWDAYFLALAFVVSQKSIDENTCHGAIIVNNRNRVVSIGYNGPPPGIDDTSIPTAGQEKYDWFIHAEMNAIYNANQALGGCVLYVTGPPCENCAKHICATEIKRVVCGKSESKMVCEKKKAVSASIFEKAKVTMTQYSQTEDIKKILERTLNYMEYKGL